MLNELVIEQPTQHDIEEALAQTGTRLATKLDKFIQILKNVQDKCTFRKRISCDPNNRPPWTKANPYKKLLKNVRTAKNAFNQNGTHENRIALKNAHIESIAEHNRLRTLHFEHIINSPPEGRKNLYDFISAKRNNKSTIPLVNHNGDQSICKTSRIMFRFILFPVRNQ